MKNIFTRFWQGAVALSVIFASTAIAKVTLYMCGDSTMDTYPMDRHPLWGQGQDFKFWFDTNYVKVVNRGAAGYTLGDGVKDGKVVQGYYDRIFKENCTDFDGKYCIAPLLQPGDYVAIQLGINDKVIGSEASFTEKLKQMVADIRAKKAHPIIMNTIAQCKYISPTVIHDEYAPYPTLIKSLAQELDVPFIDMSELTENLAISVGELYAEQFLYLFATPDEYSNLNENLSDVVHLQMNGAHAFARIITEQMRTHSDSTVKELGKYLAPMYMVDVKVSPADAAEATSANAYFPEGMTVMLKTIPKSDKKFLGWYDGDGNKVDTPSLDNVKSPYIHTFTMGNKATQYTAVYEGGTVEKYEGDGAAIDFSAISPTTSSSTTRAKISQIADNATFNNTLASVFDLQGRYLGTLQAEQRHRGNIVQALRAQFKAPGTYLVRSGNNLQKAIVK